MSQRLMMTRDSLDAARFASDHDDAKMSSRTSTRRKRTAASADHDEDSVKSPSQRSRRERSPSIVFLYIRKAAPPPFNADDADLIIHTSAGTPFRLKRHTISLASPVLAFDIGQRVQSYRTLNPRGGLPECVELTVPESDFVLEVLLRFVYFEEPVLLDLDDIIDVLEAANKYGIRIAIQGLTQALSRFLDEDPFRVFSVAQRFQLDDPGSVFKRAALKHPLRWPPTTHDPEQETSLQELYDAVKYHRKITFAAVSIMEDPSRLRLLPWDRVPGGKPPCGGTCWWPVVEAARTTSCSYRIRGRRRA